MTTKRKLAAQIIRLLSAGTKSKDSTLSERYIFEEIQQVTHRLLRLSWFENRNLGNFDANHLMIATYDTVAVLNDDTRNRNYCALPAYPENIPGGYGAQSVRPLTGNVSVDVDMIPIQPHELSMFRSLSVGMEILKDQFCWELDRDKIWFTERNNKTLLESDIDNLEVKMLVIDPSQVEADDNYPVPPGMEFDIIKEVLALHGYTSKEVADMVNNNNPNS